MAASRKVADCRQFPCSKCSVTIAGSEEEILPLAVHHAVTAHGEKDDNELRQQLRQQLRQMLRDE